MMRIKRTDTIGEIASANINTTTVFADYGIDFYSKGHRTVEHVCIDNNIAIIALLEDLNAATDQSPAGTDFSAMTVSGLTSYIVRRHHRFTEQRLVYIRNTIERVLALGGSEKEVAETKRYFAEFSVYLTVHMQHEEFIVFPAIQRLTKEKPVGKFTFSGLQEPVRSMLIDHDREAEMICRFEKLAGRYQFAGHSDYAERALYTAMWELIDDLKMHMHLENNILLPKVPNLTRLQALDTHDTGA